MGWLTLLFAVELGIVPMNTWLMYEMEPYFQSSPHYFLELETEAQAFEHLFIGGAVKTRAWKNAETWTYHPFSAEYELNAGIRIDSLEIGLRHMCTHPVIPYQATVAPREIRYEGSYDEFYIRMQIDR